jgi:hypothetical protein
MSGLAVRSSPVPLWVPLHHPRPAPGHELVGGLLSLIATSKAARARASVRQIASVS